QQLLREIVGVEARIAELDETAPARPAVARKRAAMVKALRDAGTFDSTRATLSVELGQQRAALRKWQDDHGVLTVHEGWMASSVPKGGDWGIVEETPAVLAEKTYPLHRLFPDPTVPNHDATGRTIFFGVLPVSSLDTDANGKGQFDDRATYEVRCYVRRHKA